MLWRGRNKFRDIELVDKMGGVHRIVTNPSQWFDEESPDKKYPIGTTLVVEDMVFKYCQAEADPGGSSSTIRANRAVVNKHHYQTASVVVAADAGAKSIEATVADVLAGNYENGYIIQQPTVGWTQNAKLRIKGNTTLAFELKEALKVAVKASDNLFFSKNMYAAVGKTAASGPDAQKRWDRSFVAVPQIFVTPEYYFWGQVWGPCCIQFESATYAPGVHAGYGAYATRVVFFDHYGGVSPGGEIGSDAPYYCGRGTQIAGFVIPDTWISGYGGWSILIFLQLTPW